MLGDISEGMIWAYPYYGEKKFLHRPLSNLADIAVDSAHSITKSGIVFASSEDTNFVLFPDSKIDTFVTM